MLWAGGSRWVLFSETIPLTISLPSQLIYSPPSSTLWRPTSSNQRPPPPPLPIPPSQTTLCLCAHTLSFSLPSLYLSLFLSFSLAGCEDASSTLQWRQIRPCQPCHRKTSPRKVVTSSPFQLICRHSEQGEEEGSPCSSITTSSTLSEEKKQGNDVDWKRVQCHTQAGMEIWVNAVQHMLHEMHCRKSM